MVSIIDLRIILSYGRFLQQNLYRDQYLNQEKPSKLTLCSTCIVMVIRHVTVLPSLWNQHPVQGQLVS